jgi:hypothetical protein
MAITNFKAIHAAAPSAGLGFGRAIALPPAQPADAG